MIHGIRLDVALHCTGEKRSTQRTTALSTLGFLLLLQSQNGPGRTDDASQARLFWCVKIRCTGAALSSAPVAQHDRDLCH